MNVKEGNNFREPIGRLMGKISHLFLSDLQKNLSHLDIQRSYYPLILIDSGGGNLTQQELSCKLACNKVQMVRIIDYLSSNGYVQRVQNKNDRRKYNLEVTEKARLILVDIKRAIKETSAMTLNNIPAAKVDELYDLLMKIENNLATNKTV